MHKIEEFIKRRFYCDCDWLNGNCYYFSLILKDRFPGGEIVYDVIDGHFMYQIDGEYYDWSGRVSPTGYVVEWDSFDEYDMIQKQNIIKGCLV